MGINATNERRVYIGPADGSGPIRELGDIVSDAITFETSFPSKEDVKSFKPVTFNLTAKIDSGAIKQIKHWIITGKWCAYLNGKPIKLPKPRRITFITLRHDCAKRNGRR